MINGITTKLHEPETVQNRWFSWRMKMKNILMRTQSMCVCVLRIFFSSNMKIAWVHATHFASVKRRIMMMMMMDAAGILTRELNDEFVCLKQVFYLCRTPFVIPRSIERQSFKIHLRLLSQKWKRKNTKQNTKFGKRTIADCRWTIVKKALNTSKTHISVFRSRQWVELKKKK